MKRNNFWLLIPSLFALFLFSGCWWLVIGGAAAGAGTAGTYYYVNGELKTDYSAPFDKVWNACKKTVADMHGIEVIPNKEIAQGTINTLINNEKVKIPRGTQNGKTFRLKGKGIAHIRGYGRGDQIIEIFVQIPTELSKKQEELLVEFEKLNQAAS